MNLEHVSAENGHCHRPKFWPKPIQLSVFPKISLRPACSVSNEQIERILRRMSTDELCGREMVYGYLRQQLRHNCRPNTIRSSGATILLFLTFFKNSGGEHLSAIEPEHIRAFVEHEQDRGIAPISVDGRLKGLYAFLNYLVAQDVISADVIKRKLRIRVPETLPRAMDPEDIQQLLAAIEKPRDRALILTLLRTGMRIGELLSTRVEDLNLREQLVEIFEAHKNGVGRVVYLSADAVGALRKWIKIRKYQSKFIFYGQDAGPLCYEAARGLFKSYIDKVGLTHKGYTLHCLRHTYASELLNAGMPLQCLQELLGHKSIEMTRRYARLTDNTRREAYYRAMAIIEAGEINGHYRCDYHRRSLKRRNYSNCTLRNYMSTLKQYVIWLDVPIEAATHKKLVGFIDYLQSKRLKPKTINGYLDSIRGFYNYLINEQQLRIKNPVKPGDTMRMSKPLPRFLRDEQVRILLAQIDDPRDFAIFKLMLRCGLRVQEVAKLTLASVDLKRAQVFVYHGKGAKQRVVYLSKDAYQALLAYLKARPFSRSKRLFLVNKGRFRGQPLNVRGIQYRMKYYSKKAGFKVSCHQLRHTMATQMLNADADLVTIQDLLGHAYIRTTERYCRVSNQKVRRDYYRAMDKVIERHGSLGKKTLDKEEILIN